MDGDGSRGRSAPEASADRSRGCLLRASHGHQDALADLYDVTVDQVHRLAVLLTRGDAQHVEQVVRETYREVWRTAGRFDPSADQPLSWVLGIARTAARRPQPRSGPGGVVLDE